MVDRLRSFTYGRETKEIILGGNFPGGSYLGWEISLVGVFLVGIVRWESSERQFSGWKFFEAECHKAECHIEAESHKAEYKLLKL